MIKETIDQIDSSYWTGRGEFKIDPVPVFDNTIPKLPDTRSEIEKEN